MTAQADVASAADVDTGTGPVFVVGAPLSGTAAVHAGLVAHPEMQGAGRGEFLAPLLMRLPDIYAAGTRRGRLQWLAAQQVGYGEFVRHVGYGVERLFADRADGLRWVDHSPVYARFLDPLAAMFPSASVVFVNRDGREVVAAMAERYPGVSHRLACRIWGRYADAWRRAAATGLRLLEVRHDRLTAEPDSQMRRIEVFLDASPAEAASGALGAALDGQDPVSWRHWDGTARRQFEDAAGCTLRALGFAADSSWVRNAD